MTHQRHKPDPQGFSSESSKKIVITDSFVLTIADEDLQRTEPNDIVVNFVRVGTTQFDGLTSRSLLAAAGVDMDKEFILKYKNGLAAGDIAVTKSYGLNCQAVFHLGLIPWVNTVQEDILSVGRSFLELLRMADEWGARRIVFPIFAVDGALLGYTGDVLRDIIIGVAKRFPAVKVRPQLLQEMRVIIFKNKNLFKVFTSCDVTMSIKPSSDPDTFYCGVHLTITDTLLAHIEMALIEKVQSDVAVRFVNSNLATTDPEDSIDERIYDAITDHREVALKLGKLQTGNMLFTRNNGPALVDVFYLGFSLGADPELYLDKLKILEVMLSKCLEMAEKLHAYSIAIPVYQYKCLKSYPNQTIMKLMIDAAHRIGPQCTHLQTLRLTVAEQSMFSDISAMFEQIATSNNERKGAMRNLLRMDSTDESYNDICHRFLHECGSHLKVIQIYRNTNVRLFDRFNKKLCEMKSKNVDQGLLERSLWHGTRKEQMERICRDGFDPGLSGSIHGSILGSGTYFTSRGNYATIYTESDSDDVRHLIIAKVITGRYTDVAENGILPPGFDSTVDNAEDPHVFVAYTRENIFPEYVVAYKKPG